MARRRSGDYTLTEKQREVLALSASGLTTYRIAKQLGVGHACVYKRLRRARALQRSQEIKETHANLLAVR